MCLETSSYEFARFRQLGFNVLITEYPGYGMSSGQASESGCYEAADAAYHYLTEILSAWRQSDRDAVAASFKPVLHNEEYVVV